MARNGAAPSSIRDHPLMNDIRNGTATGRESPSRFAFRQPAFTASSSEQNQRSPLLGVMTIHRSSLVQEGDKSVRLFY